MEEQLFRYKSVNINKLLEFGCVEINSFYVYRRPLLDNQFEMTVAISEDGNIKTIIVDNVTEEPYTLHLDESACGAFIGGVRSEYIDVLSEISEKCYDRNVFTSEYAHNIIKYIREKYSDELEYLWQKFPTNAIWRREDNGKWYGVLLVLSKRKLGLNSDDNVDIIDLRVEPEVIESIVDNTCYYAGYHMNKRNWITIVLDGSVPIERIYQHIDISYRLASNIKSKIKTNIK